MLRKRWWIVLSAVLLALVAAVFVFWDGIIIHVAPRLVLSKAVVNTFSGFQERFDQSPLSVLAKVIDGSGRNTIDFSLDTENSLLGPVKYRLNVQTEGSPRQVSASGTVALPNSTLDIALYLNKDFAAISSDGILNGNYYGVTYDTFREDIRSIPLVSLLIGEKTLQRWEDSLGDLQEQMSRSCDFPDISGADIQSAVQGIIALKPSVARDTMTLNGQKRGVYRISFLASGDDIAAAAQGYTHMVSEEILALLERLQSDPDAQVDAVFCLYEERVVKLTFNMLLEGKSLQLELLSGPDITKDDLHIAVILQTPEALQKWAVEVESQYDARNWAGKLNIISVENGIQAKTLLDYTWDKSTGDLYLEVIQGQEKTMLNMNLQETASGFRISTGQYEKLMNLFREEKKTGGSSCVMEVKRGGTVSAPEYKNIDQWSIEDLLALLEGLGGLLGWEPL